MTPIAVLDTHVVARALVRPERLTREQRRFIDRSEQKGRYLGVSAMSLVELAHLDYAGKVQADLVFREIERQSVLILCPITLEIARQSAAVAGSLHDPADCVITATALILDLPLVTSDQRIIESGVVRTIS